MLVHGWHHLRPLDEGDAATVKAEGVAEHFGNLRKVVDTGSRRSGHSACELCHGKRWICLAVLPTAHAR